MERTTDKQRTAAARRVDEEPNASNTLHRRGYMPTQRRVAQRVDSHVGEARCQGKRETQQACGKRVSCARKQVAGSSLFLESKNIKD
jgi:hypothetical protein